MANDKLFRSMVPGIVRRLLKDIPEWGEEDVFACLGNAGAESGGFTLLQEINPTVAGSQGGWGWFQWTGPRRREFNAYADGRGLKRDSFEANYGFLVHELRMSEKQTVPRVKNARGLDAKVIAFEQAFERAGIKHYDSRKRWARVAKEEYAKTRNQTVSVPTVTPAKEAPQTSTMKQNTSFWAKMGVGAGSIIAVAWNWFISILPWIALAVGIIVLVSYVLRPAFLRWQAHLSNAPEMANLSFFMRLRVFASGYKSQMVARATEGVSALVVFMQVIDTYAGAGVFGLNDLLPAIPLGASMSLEPTQYIALIGILLGRLQAYLRSISSQPEGMVDPRLAITIAAESDAVDGIMPSEALTAVTPIAAIEHAPVQRKRRVSHTRRVAKRRRAA